MGRTNGLLDEFRTLAPMVRRQFGVVSLSLFGSMARGDERENSDIDLLVEFDGPAKFDEFMDLKFFLEDHLHRRIDLVTRKALRPEMQPLIEAEMIRVA